MRLAATIELYGGGPGSGCRGPNCGRPESALPQGAFLDQFRDKTQDTDTSPGSRNNPINVGDDVRRAVKLIREGKHVQVNQPDEIATLVEKIKKDATIFHTEGKPLPNFNMGDISVAGKNVFLGNLGISRTDMPQTGGLLLPGSPALPKGADLATTDVDLAPQFIQSLKDKGIAVTDEMAPASHLRATQDQLDGRKIGELADRIAAGTLKEEPIFVTKDNYILDGHHRWAAEIVADAKDNRFGDVMIPVHRINADIGTALSLASDFQKKWMIAPAVLTGQKMWWLPGQPVMQASRTARRWE